MGRYYYKVINDATDNSEDIGEVNVKAAREFAREWADGNPYVIERVSTANMDAFDRGDAGFVDWRNVSIGAPPKPAKRKAPVKRKGKGKGKGRAKPKSRTARKKAAAAAPRARLYNDPLEGPRRTRHPRHRRAMPAGWSAASADSTISRAFGGGSGGGATARGSGRTRTRARTKKPKGIAAFF